METVSWNETEIKSTLAATAKANKDESKKNIFLNLRKTLTGKERGPEIQKIIFLLGKEEVKQRISIQLSS
jgi:lysyl-tRNA synthetase class I